jgi:hypothetical protein
MLSDNSLHTTLVGKARYLEDGSRGYVSCTGAVTSSALQLLLRSAPPGVLILQVSMYYSVVEQIHPYQQVWQ